MKQAEVSDLKAHLSAYLAEVRRGETVLVFDRKTPIARLVPHEQNLGGFEVEEPVRPTSKLKKVRGVQVR